MDDTDLEAALTDRTGTIQSLYSTVAAVGCVTFTASRLEASQKDFAQCDSASTQTARSTNSDSRLIDFQKCRTKLLALS